MDVYRKKQQWKSTNLPNPVISPLRNYERLLDPPTARWPVFPTFDQRALAALVRDELADRGLPPEAIADRRDAHARDQLLDFEEDIRPCRLPPMVLGASSSDSRLQRSLMSTT